MLEKIYKTLLVIQDALLTNKEVLTLDEFCTYAGISKNTAYQLTSSGKIRFYRPSGKLIYFAKEDVIEFLKQNPTIAVKDISKQLHRRLFK